ncbi:MAG: DcrB-related protein [Janthinobacterium lividum]
MTVTTTMPPPQGWVDKTMIVHSAPHDPAQALAPNIVVGRDALIEGEKFADFCSRQAAVFRENLPGYAEEERESGQLDGRTAMRLNFTWTSGAGPLRQEAVFIDAGEGVVVNFTSSAAADDFETYRKLFYDQLALLKITAE